MLRPISLAVPRVSEAVSLIGANATPIARSGSPLADCAVAVERLVERLLLELLLVLARDAVLRAGVALRATLPDAGRRALRRCGRLRGNLVITSPSAGAAGCAGSDVGALIEVVAAQG
jgi:hypothetical protein